MAVYFEPRSPTWADYIAPAAQELLTGVMGPTGAKNDPRALLGTYTQLLKQFTDPYSGQPISGYEDLVAGLTEEVRGLMTAMANGQRPQGSRPAPATGQGQESELQYDPVTGKFGAR